MAAEELHQTIITLLEASVAPSSLQVYKRAWVLFAQAQYYLYPQETPSVTIPITVSQVSMFVAYLHKEGYSPSSIVSYTSSLGYTHRLMGYIDPTSSKIVQKLIAGALKVNPPAPPRLPITIVILNRLLQAVDIHINHYYHRPLLKAMFVTSFFGLMRMGEVTMSKHGMVPLQMDQLQLTQDKIIISISEFKHNSKLEPVDIIFPRNQDESMCPVVLMSSYLILRGFQQGPIFAYPSLAPIKRSFFYSKLGFLLRSIGCDVDRYQSHSFRIGGASYFAQLGYTDSQIRLLGRWDSNAFIRYIRDIRAHTHSS